MPRNYCVNLYCPCCRDIFYPKNARQATLDGAYFGTTFAHMFLLINEDIQPAKMQQTYIPRVFGFKIHKDSTYWHSRAPPSTASPAAEADAKRKGAATGETSGFVAAPKDGNNQPNTVFNMPVPPPGGNGNGSPSKARSDLPKPP